MKRSIAIILSALILLSVCAVFSGCGKNNSESRSKIVVSKVEIKEGDASQTGNHHRIEVSFKVNEDISKAVIRYVFSKDGESYYFEDDFHDLSKGSMMSRDIPLSSDLIYTNTDSSGSNLSSHTKDILDILGAGTKVTAEMYVDGELISDKSTEY